MLFAKVTRIFEASTLYAVLAKRDYKFFAYATHKYDLAVT